MKELLELFAETEIFIFVFAEIVTKITAVQHVIFRKSSLKEYIIFVILFGVFSIFGTLVGVDTHLGVVSNIRDFAPLFAGLLSGPYVGLSVGLIGGVHRYLMGGITCIPCSISTVLAGVIGGLVYLWNKKRLIGIVQGMLLAIAVEALHGAVNLLMVRPLDTIFDIVKAAIPAMMIANALGIAIGIIIVEHIDKEQLKVDEEAIKTKSQNQY